jgi:hypothetical protein
VNKDELGIAKTVAERIQRSAFLIPAAPARDFPELVWCCADFPVGIFLKRKKISFIAEEDRRAFGPETSGGPMSGRVIAENVVKLFGEIFD